MKYSIKVSYFSSLRYECFDGYCLFDVHSDPCEYRNVARQNEQVLNMTVALLLQYRREIVRHVYPDVDPNADPTRTDGYWDTWLERGASGPSSRGRSSGVLTLFSACIIWFFTANQGFEPVKTTV